MFHDLTLLWRNKQAFLGSWIPNNNAEEFEGVFGVFQSKKISSFYMQRLEGVYKYKNAKSMSVDNTKGTGAEGLDLQT